MRRATPPFRRHVRARRGSSPAAEVRTAAERRRVRPLRSVLPGKELNVSTDPSDGLASRPQPGPPTESTHEHGTAAYASTDAPAGGPQSGGYPQPRDGGQGPYPPQGMYGQPGPYPPQGQYPPQYQQQHDGGPGIGDRASHAMTSFGRHVKTPETKEFFKTSEFGVWVFTVLAIAIAGAVIDASSHNDALRADLVWKLIAGVSAVYILSRGIAKAGTRRGYGDRPMDRS